MRQNKLKIFYGYEFSELSSLEYLDLSSNLIQFIALNTFKKLINLKYLNLNFNSLKHIIEDKQYFIHNLKLDYYLNDDKIIQIYHENSSTGYTTEIPKSTTTDSTLAYVYEIGVLAKMNLLINNSDLVLFECINKIFDKLLITNISQFNHFLTSKAKSIKR